MENYDKIRLPWPEWRIVKCIGSGAYGKVYEIERNTAGVLEKAALKIVSRPKDASEVESYYDNGYDKASIVASYESEIRNYVQEYKMMKELQGQSNIVSCDDFEVVPHKNGIGGDIFLRMELLTSLQQILRDRMLSEPEIIKLGKDICHALVLCGSKNIIHRDIKPLNIMVSQFGDYKLGDFGVSKIMDHATYATLMGTPEYQAPEVVHMEKYGQTADIYSLGITLYWLLNNRRMPFISADEKLTPAVKDEAIKRRYRGEELPPPKNGSHGLKEIVLKACAYCPEDRYVSAQEMYEALENLSDKGSTEKPKTGNDTARANDLHVELEISAEEAADGGDKYVDVIYPDGQRKTFQIAIPSDILETGYKIRLRGQGLREEGKEPGDLYFDIRIPEETEFNDTLNTVGGIHAAAGSSGYRCEDDQTAGNSWGESNGTIGRPGKDTHSSHQEKAEEERYTETVGVKKDHHKQAEKKTENEEAEVTADHTTAEGAGGTGILWISVMIYYALLYYLSTMSSDMHWIVWLIPGVMLLSVFVVKNGVLAAVAGFLYGFFWSIPLLVLAMEKWEGAGLVIGVGCFACFGGGIFSASYAYVEAKERAEKKKWKI